MFVKKVPNLSYLEKIRVVNQLQTQSNSSSNNSNNTIDNNSTNTASCIKPLKSNPSSNTSRNLLNKNSKPTSSIHTNMLLTRALPSTNNNIHHHHGRQHYMPHKTLKANRVQLMDHPDIPPYILAMAKNSQTVQKEKDSDNNSGLFPPKIKIPVSNPALHTNYSSSSLSTLSPSSPCLDFSPTASPKNNTKSVKRFISHSQTHNLIQKNDLVFINIDEEMSILNMIDPLFHGKIGIVSEIREDDCVIEIVENANNDSDDNMCFMNMTVNQPIISHSFQPQTMLRREVSKCPSLKPAKRRIVVPIFCLCLEDVILKERLANLQAQR